MFVEEGPRRDDDEEGESGAGETDIERESDVLGRVPGEESDDLK